MQWAAKPVQVRDSYGRSGEAPFRGAAGHQHHAQRGRWKPAVIQAILGRRNGQIGHGFLCREAPFLNS